MLFLRLKSFSISTRYLICKKYLSIQKMQSWKVTGLITAPVTPFDSNCQINFHLFEQYAEIIKNNGISNLFVNGTTGEGLSMTVEERKKTAEKWMDVGKNRFDKVIVHIGTGNYMESMELAKHAESIKADGISCVAPSYYLPTTNEDYVNYMAKVASAAPNTPFILYDINFLTGIYNLPVSDFFNLAKTKIPTLRGVKHTSPQLDSINRFLIEHPDMQMLMGTNDLYLEGLAIGCDTTICDSFVGNILNGVKLSFNKGDLVNARKLQNKVVKLMDIRRKMSLTVPGGSKAIIRCMGLPVGQVRLPVATIGTEDEKYLKDSLEKIDFFNWGKNFNEN